MASMFRIETPRGQRTLLAKFVVGCDGGASTTREAIGARLVGVDLRRALAGHRCVDQQSRRRKNHVLLRPAAADSAAACGGLARQVRIHAAARRSPDELASDGRVEGLLAPYRRFLLSRNRASCHLYLSRPRRRCLAQGTRPARRRRCAFDAAVRRTGHEWRHEGLRQSRLETRRRHRGQGRRRHPR